MDRDTVMGALTDLRVIDLSTNVAGPFCTKLFADFGADVIKVESTDQVDESRTLGPFPNENGNAETSGMFLYLNANKRSVRYPLKNRAGQQPGVFQQDRSKRHGASSLRRTRYPAG